jgi:hypothetical protein
MANSNTIAMAPKAATRGGSTDGTTETIFVKASDSTKNCSVYVPESAKLNNQRFNVRARGHVSAGTTSNFTAALYWGTSTAVAGNTKIATTAATAYNVTSGQWEINAWLLWSSTSLIVQGRQEGDNNNTAVALAAISNTVTNVSPSTANSLYQFNVSSLFSSSSTTNVATLDELSIEIV